MSSPKNLNYIKKRIRNHTSSPESESCFGPPFLFRPGLADPPLLDDEDPRPLPPAFQGGLLPERRAGERRRGGGEGLRRRSRSRRSERLLNGDILRLDNIIIAIAIIFNFYRKLS